MIDVLVLDDQHSVRQAIVLVAKSLGLTTIDFLSGVEALQYLTACTFSTLPRAYCIDMRIPGPTEELESPLRIYEFLKEKRKVENFYFMTNNLSEHDLEVIAKTGATAYQKSEIEKIYHHLNSLNAQS